MNLRLTDHPRIAGWLTARANVDYMAAYMRAEDALTIERDKVRALQSQLADEYEANRGHQQARESDGEAIRSLEQSLTVETALVGFLALIAGLDAGELAHHRESITKSITDGEAILRRAFGHPSTYTEGEQ